MWKYLFKPYYSVFELLALMCVFMVVVSVGFWIGLMLVPIIATIQIIATYMINKQESIKQDSVV